jgi:uncharacterized membrane protein
MTNNLIAYVIYTVVTYWITVHVGRSIHRHGIYYIQVVVPDDTLAQGINNLLLLGYYLVNIGYITLQIWHWDTVRNLREVVESVSDKTGRIVLLLAFLHVINMVVIARIGKRHFFSPQ